MMKNKGADELKSGIDSLKFEVRQNFFPCLGSGCSCDEVKRRKDVSTSSGLSGILGKGHPSLTKQNLFASSTQSIFPFLLDQKLQKFQDLSSKVAVGGIAASLMVNDKLSLFRLAVTAAVRTEKGTNHVWMW